MHLPCNAPPPCKAAHRSAHEFRDACEHGHDDSGFARNQVELERIAIDTRRSTSFLAAEAVSAYVERELQSLDGIKRALADARLGHVVPHDDAMAEIHAVIDAAEAARDAVI